MSGEVIHWNLNALAFLQTLQSFNQQLKVKSIRTIEVVLILICQFMLFLVQNLMMREHIAINKTEQRQPRVCAASEVSISYLLLNALSRNKTHHPLQMDNKLNKSKMFS